MSFTRSFAVYHLASIAEEACDGLFIVKAADKFEAQMLVEEKLEPGYFNDCIVEELSSVDESKILLEFWRKVPIRQPLVRDKQQSRQQQMEEAAA